MDWDAHRAIIDTWRTQTLDYVDAINRFVERGNRDGWDKAGEQPTDPRTAELGEAIATLVQEANKAGAWAELRARVPPAQAPFIPILEKRAVSVSSVLFIDEDHVAALLDGPYAPEGVMVFGYDGSSDTSTLDASAVGASPDRRFFALQYGSRIEVHEGWQGPEVASFACPRGDEDTPEGFAPLEADERLAIDAMHVLPDASGVVVASSSGVFLTGADGIRRLCPSQAELLEWLAEDPDEEPYPVSVSMPHAAVHPRGEFIACGHQSSPHLLLRPDGSTYATFGPIHSEYPHHAAFSPDGARAIFNSCHFYNGASVIAYVRDLEGVALPEYEEDIRLLPLEGRSRVYDSSFVDGAFLLGDANGYVRSVLPSGDPVFTHFVGSSVGGVDVSPSGDRLAIGTAAGFLALTERSTEPDPAQIGDSPFRERIRFVRCRDAPLLRW